MAQRAQSYKDHRRFFAPYHYVAIPILAANVVVNVVRAIRAPSWWTLWLVVLAIGLVFGIAACRGSTLIVQNRLIGLEMRLRLAAVLPPALVQRIPELALRQLIGLRFAGDAELPALVERCLSGELASADQVKREVREWRPDFVRA